MELINFLITLFMLVIAPLLLLSNHNLFFILVAFILITASVQSIYKGLFRIRTEIPEEDSEFLDEMEFETNIDIRKAGTGLKFSRNLVSILFFIYCSLYLRYAYQIVLTAFIILYWVYNTRKLFPCSTTRTSVRNRNIIENIAAFLVNIATIAILIIVTYNKFINI